MPLHGKGALMKRFRILVAACLVATTSGCVTTPNNYQPQSTQISFPELNTPVSASIGDNMLSQGTSTLVRGILLREQNRIGVYEFNPGFYPQIGEDGESTFHSFQTSNQTNGMGWLRIGGILPGSPYEVQSLRAAKNRQQLCAIVGAFGQTACDTEHAYERVERPVVGPNNFQQTLIYNGRVGDRIRIGYREFSGDVARPAFSNEVDYDLSESREITYRGARLRIIEANNQRIDYVVLSNFNTQSR
jgi:hypothetical protein